MTVTTWQGEELCVFGGDQLDVVDADGYGLYIIGPLDDVTPILTGDAETCVGALIELEAARDAGEAHFDVRAWAGVGA